MDPQAFKALDHVVVERFIERRRGWREPPEQLKFSWSTWGFGTEALADSAARLERNEIEWIELPGNLYGTDLGYDAEQVNDVLAAHGIAVSGICGMVMPEQELASNRPHVRQRFVDYLRRQIEFCVSVGGHYVLFGAAAVGRPDSYDTAEVDRAAETLALVADDFAAAGIAAAIEPIRPDETSIIHSCAEAAGLIARIDRPGVQHIAGDVYHMLSGDGHVGTALLEYAPQMANLHLADSNRRALGTGQLDIDIIIMALYASGFHRGTRFCTAEPLGGGANPYDAMYGHPDTDVLDELVTKSVSTWRGRERALLGATDDELRAASGAPAGG